MTNALVCQSLLNLPDDVGKVSALNRNSAGFLSLPGVELGLLDQVGLRRQPDATWLRLGLEAVVAVAAAAVVVDVVKAWAEPTEEVAERANFGAELK